MIDSTVASAGVNSYPSAERQNCGFGIQYLKWLFSSGASYEIGPEATAVLTAIVTLEDEFFYNRAVNFYNEQLMRRCGIKSEHALIRARKVAIDAGLLDYTAGQKRTPGRYFVCGFIAQNAGDQPDTTAPNAANVKRKSIESQKPLRNTQRKPNGSETVSRPSIPINPITQLPVDNNVCSESENDFFIVGGVKNPVTYVDDWIFPEGWDCPELRKALDDWAAMRKRIKKPIRSKASTSKLFKRFESVMHLIDVCEICEANQWQGLKPEYGNGKSQPKTFGQMREKNNLDVVERARLRDLERETKPHDRIGNGAVPALRLRGSST
ncbi:MAG: hypothetical protein R3C03_09380 [Pirellulaceae bacterium]